MESWRRPAKGRGFRSDLFGDSLSWNKAIFLYFLFALSIGLKWKSKEGYGITSKAAHRSNCNNNTFKLNSWYSTAAFYLHIYLFPSIYLVTYLNILHVALRFLL